MNFLSWTIAIGLLVTLLMTSLKLHQAILCRQEAWRSSAVLLTNQLLSEAKDTDSIISPRCQTYTYRSQKRVSWKRDFKSHAFSMNLQGKL